MMQTNSPQTHSANSSAQPDVLKDNQFRGDAVHPGSALLVGDIAVFNVAGHFCATQVKCPHKQGPLNEGKLDESTVTCPWHGSNSMYAQALYCKAQQSIRSKLTA
jgi:nitrite reductase (NADH) small subunit